MILQVNYEEQSALKAGAHAVLGDVGYEAPPVMAPTERRARVEAFLAQLAGDLSLSTLAEVREARAAVAVIAEHFRAEMESAVLATHPADETAVASYFDYAHAITVSDRLGRMAAEMEALIELMTGAPATPQGARDFRFPD